MWIMASSIQQLCKQKSNAQHVFTQAAGVNYNTQTQHKTTEEYEINLSLREKKRRLWIKRNREKKTM